MAVFFKNPVVPFFRIGSPGAQWDDFNAFSKSNLPAAHWNPIKIALTS